VRVVVEFSVTVSVLVLKTPLEVVARRTKSTTNVILAPKPIRIPLLPPRVLKARLPGRRLTSAEETISDIGVLRNP
jgi:hypothetical protein